MSRKCRIDIYLPEKIEAIKEALKNYNII